MPVTLSPLPLLGALSLLNSFGVDYEFDPNDA